MRPVQRTDILDLGAYEQIRDSFRNRIIALKKHRRIAVGDHLTFVFENRETAMFQIQEMLRTERISKESAISHEIETYNSMVPGSDELFATLFVEYEDRAERHAALAAMPDLGKHITLRLGEREAKAEFELLPGEDGERLPPVNYVRFQVGAGALDALRDVAQPARIEVTHSYYSASVDLPATMREELASDLEEP